MHIGGGPSRGLGRAAGGLAAESRHLHHGEKTPSVRSVRPAGAAPEASRRRGAPFHSLSGVCFWPPGLIGFHVCVLFDNRNVLVSFEFLSLYPAVVRRIRHPLPGRRVMACVSLVCSLPLTQPLRLERGRRGDAPESAARGGHFCRYRLFIVKI